MKTHLIVRAFLIFILMFSLRASGDTMPGMKTLPGYRVSRGRAIDAVVWTIEKPGGPIIEFESGPSEGRIKSEEPIYSWYKEQTVTGYKVQLAFIKPGLQMRFEPPNRRGMKPGSILIVAFHLNPEHPDETAVFTSKIASLEEL